jgi:hypothetical protein
MRTAKSSGYDKISVKLLQAAGSAIIEPLALSAASSLQLGIEITQ